MTNIDVRDYKQQFNTCLQLVRTPLEKFLMAMKKNAAPC